MCSKAAKHAVWPPPTPEFLELAGREFEGVKIERQREKANNEEAHACDPKVSADSMAPDRICPRLCDARGLTLRVTLRVAAHRYRSLTVFFSDQSVLPSLVIL